MRRGPWFFSTWRTWEIDVNAEADVAADSSPALPTP